MKRFIMSSLLLVFSIGYAMEEGMSPESSYYFFNLPNQQLLENLYTAKKEILMQRVQKDFDRALKFWESIITSLEAKLNKDGYLEPENPKQKIAFTFYGFPAYAKLDVLTPEEKYDERKVIQALAELTLLEILYHLTVYLFQEAQKDSVKLKKLKDAIHEYAPLLTYEEIEKIKKKKETIFETHMRKLYDLQTKNLFILLPDEYKMIIDTLRGAPPPK